MVQMSGLWIRTQSLVMLAFPRKDLMRVSRINHRRCQPQTQDNIILNNKHFGSKIWWFERVCMFQILGLCVRKCIWRNHDKSHKDSNLIWSSYASSNYVDIEVWGDRIIFLNCVDYILNLELYKLITHSLISSKHMYCFLGMFLNVHPTTTTQLQVSQ